MPKGPTERACCLEGDLKLCEERPTTPPPKQCAPAPWRGILPGKRRHGNHPHPPLPPKARLLPGGGYGQVVLGVRQPQHQGLHAVLAAPHQHAAEVDAKRAGLGGAVYLEGAERGFGGVSAGWRFDGAGLWRWWALHSLHAPATKQKQAPRVKAQPMSNTHRASSAVRPTRSSVSATRSTSRHRWPSAARHRHRPPGGFVGFPRGFDGLGLGHCLVRFPGWRCLSDTAKGRVFGGFDRACGLNGGCNGTPWCSWQILVKQTNIPPSCPPACPPSNHAAIWCCGTRGTRRRSTAATTDSKLGAVSEIFVGRALFSFPSGLAWQCYAMA
jgi:hypothetical protein